MSVLDLSNKQFFKTGIGNTLQFQNYFDRLFEIATSRFDWQNLPETVNIRYMERALVTQGRAVAFNDEELGGLVLSATDNGFLDVYGDPVHRRAVGQNGYNVELTNYNSVLIYNNYQRRGLITVLQDYAAKLSLLDQVTMINANAQKTPILLVCEKSQLQTMKNLYMKYEGGEPVIYAGTGLNVDGIKVLKTDAPFICDKMYDIKKKIWNEAITFLGVPNSEDDKRERKIVDEVNRELVGTAASSMSALCARQEACREMQKTLGWSDVWCELRAFSAERQDELTELPEGTKAEEEETE